MYELEVFFPDEPHPRHVERVAAPSEAMTRIPELLAEHEGCERIEVRYGADRLFAVDRQSDAALG